MKNIIGWAMLTIPFIAAIVISITIKLNSGMVESLVLGLLWVIVSGYLINSKEKRK